MRALSRLHGERTLAFLRVVVILTDVIAFISAVAKTDGSKSLL